MIGLNVFQRNFGNMRLILYLRFLGDNRMKTKDTQMIIFNIQNKQEDYAICLEFIKYYEKKNISIFEKIEKLTEIIQNREVCLRNFDERASYRWIEEPIQKRGQSIIEAEKNFRNNLHNSKKLDKAVISALLNNNRNLHYHLRIHMEFESGEIQPGNLVHFQYLVLLLKRLSSIGFFNKKLEKELSVFLVPSSADTYPFLDKNGMFDTKSYNVVSQYLRMVTKRFNGVIFCAHKKGDRIGVHALETHSISGCETYFPVIFIDASMYNRLFNINNDMAYFDGLKEINREKNIVDFGEASNKNPMIAIPDFIVKTAYKRIMKMLNDSCESVFEILYKHKKTSIIRFCLFAFLINNEEDLEGKWKLSGEVERGLRQIIQNSIQHSETHECVFSFYLHEKSENETGEIFLKRMTAEYPSISDNLDSNKMMALEVFVSDLNEKQDMLDSFLTNLESDIEVYRLKERDKVIGHQKLIDNIQHISIRNLFSEFSENDLKEMWLQFRKQDIVAHIGLSLFGITAEKCKAAIKVLSSKDSMVMNDKNCFYKVYGNQNISDCNLVGTRIIPGTQFSVLIPVRQWAQVQGPSLGQLDLQKKILEDYRSFTHWINYEEKRIPVMRRLELEEKKNNTNKFENNRVIENHIDKSAAVMLWYRFWRKRLESNREQSNSGNIVFNHDFEEVSRDVYFYNNDYIEVCLKGLIMSLNEINLENMDLYLALTNLPNGFVKSFCNIASLIGVRDFPENIQLYLSEYIDENEKHNDCYELIVIGKNYSQVMYHAYILSIEHGTIGCTYHDYKKTIELYKKIVPFSEVENEENIDRSEICPFDTILTISTNSNTTLFEQKVRLMAENELDSDSNGYKLNYTHMRLGSKVHIESFYEMSFLFYRTSIANRIAFLILRDLVKADELNIKEDSIIFYGYASYSKAILTSLTEILRFLRKDKYKNKVGFASYQHNLQSDSNDVQMYFGLESDSFGKVNDKNILELKEDVKVVQVVPISTTLTTFSKMREEFINHLSGKRNAQIYKNYTVFWVVDQASEKPAVIPSSIERKYWIEVNKKNIKTTFSALEEGGNIYVKYFIYSSVIWHSPLTCPLCFPANVIEEIPLVETDPTSTVPSQQVRYRENFNFTSKDSEELIENTERLLKLKDCIIHGHIVRRQNHYQYYVDTQRYFYNVKGDVMRWLENMPDKKKLFLGETPTLHIIFSPEHNTNVGFAQYVNTYYFDGLAEVVSINVDKEYRSNFVCEHAALMKVIENLYITEEDRKNPLVRFYFVDDTIITGETLEKANGFLHSLIPHNLPELYHANLFDKIFLLMDRLSKDTKRMYVENIDENFHSFVHIDVSNIRIQGDSCVGCKLEQNTKKMLKRSATKVQAKYWSQKLYKYRKIDFDDLNELEKIDKERSFNRMMLYHVLQNVIIKNGHAYTVGETYDVLLDLMEWFLSNGESGNIYGYQSLFEKTESINNVKNLLKIICRPFFSFDYKIKLQVLTLFVFLTEYMLENINDKKILEELKQNSRKKFMYENERKERTVKIAEKINLCLCDDCEKLDFLIEYMFEGLTEMGSTYLMRKQSLQKVYSYINKMSDEKHLTEKINTFLERYALNIHRLLSNTKDETKEAWLEYLYSTGNEFTNENNNQFIWNVDKECPQLYKTIIQDNEDGDVSKKFKEFIYQLFFQNTGVNFDGIERINGLRISDEYFMESWKAIHSYEQLVLNHDKNMTKFEEENNLFLHLKNRQEPEKNKSSVKEWYGKFLWLITSIGEKKYGFIAEDVNIIFMTDNSNYEDREDYIGRLDIINEVLGSHTDNAPIERYIAKNRLGEAIRRTTNQKSQLEEVGYLLEDGSKDDSYFILFFDNYNIEQEEVDGNRTKTLAKVFLYMSIKNKNENKSPIGIRYIMRDIFTYRNRLLCILEQDFYGDTFINYARTNEERNILSHEKAASHSASTDDDISIELFVRNDLNKKKIYKYLDDNQKAHWLLIRNYTNNQIAKLFNRSFRDDAKGEIPPLYLHTEMECEFGQKLISFKDLGISKVSGKQDGRFAWIQKIMDLDIRLEDNATFIKNSQNEAFNLEYFKCIVVDILISAIKFQSYEREDFLMRIEKFMQENAQKEDGGKVCSAKIYRLESRNKDVDYFVIENPVNKIACGLIDWEARNDLIKMRLKDPLDFIDGHMSLLTIKRYVEKLGATNLTCSFSYELLNNKLIFVTKLPVLKRKDN